MIFKEKENGQVVTSRSVSSLVMENLYGWARG